MKPERCQAIAASGQPCSAKPRPGRPYCLWHDPEAAELRAEISRKGGQSRSNVSRAGKQLPAHVLTTDQLRGVVGKTIKQVIAGELDPGVGNAIANLARAYVAVTEAGAIDKMAEQIAELEQRLPTKGWTA